jgi:mono/diheme cytochrome c family protein
MPRRATALLNCKVKAGIKAILKQLMNLIVAKAAQLFRAECRQCHQAAHSAAVEAPVSRQ